MIKTRTNYERENTQRSKRLRKKLHVAEFKQNCVNIYFDCNNVDKDVDVIDYILEIAYNAQLVIGTVSSESNGMVTVIVELTVGNDDISCADDAKLQCIEKGIESIGGKYIDSHMYDAWHFDELLYDVVEKKVWDEFNIL